jgi:hypothetical protein
MARRHPSGLTETDESVANSQSVTFQSEVLPLPN